MFATGNPKDMKFNDLMSYAAKKGVATKGMNRNRYQLNQKKWRDIMISDVEICNLALSKIGESTINTLTEATVEAQTCTPLYNPLDINFIASRP